MIAAQAGDNIGIVQISLKAIAGTIIAVKAVIGSNLERPVLIFQYGVHGISAQAVQSIGIMPIDGELIAIELIQAIESSKPHKSVAILYDAGDRTL